MWTEHILPTKTERERISITTISLRDLVGSVVCFGSDRNRHIKSQSKFGGSHGSNFGIYDWLGYADWYPAVDLRFPGQAHEHETADVCFYGGVDAHNRCLVCR